MGSDTTTQSEESDQSQQTDNDNNNNNNKIPDIPMPTDAGGYTHTTASRAKISAANKGKVPWNKGKARSEETKARIREGVRRKNRERFLQKLKDLGMTEEEYEAKKKEDRKKKDAERRARRTANGGYTPTKETREKISKVLKEKFANGEIKKREYHGPYRKGFTHSEETKEKIRQSLKEKWASDPAYQEKMRASNDKKSSVRNKISNTLKERWKDPEFRAKMMKSFKSRPTKRTNSGQSAEQRAKISAAMKKKWQDKSYRKKTLEGMEAYRESLPPKPKKKRAIRPRASATIELDDVVPMMPMTEGKKKKVRASKKTTTPSTSTAGGKKIAKKKQRRKKKTSTVVAVGAKTAENADKAPAKSTGKGKGGKKEKKKDDGDIARMREERRDLYDLLYGDEGGSDASEGEDSTSNATGEFNIDEIPEASSPNGQDPSMFDKGSSLSFFGESSSLDDENLDDYDPYGLEDF